MVNSIGINLDLDLDLIVCGTLPHCEPALLADQPRRARSSLRIYSSMRYRNNEFDGLTVTCMDDERELLRRLARARDIRARTAHSSTRSILPTRCIDEVQRGHRMIFFARKYGVCTACVARACRRQNSAVDLFIKIPRQRISMCAECFKANL